MKGKKEQHKKMAEAFLRFLKKHKNDEIPALVLVLTAVLISCIAGVFSYGVQSGAERITTEAETLPGIRALSETETPPAEESSETPVEESTAPTEPSETSTESSTAEEESYRPTPGELNLTYFFPEGVDQSDASKSLAGEAFKILMTKDVEWLNGIYDLSDIAPAEMAARLGKPISCVMGRYNPNNVGHDKDNPDTWIINSFQTIRMTATDGDGNPITPYSNVKDIMSMANLYTYFKGVEDQKMFLDYSEKLWKQSHSYSLDISDVYYCPGCLTEDEEKRQLEELEASGTAAMATLSDAREASAANASSGCPGHVDLIIHMKIVGLKERKSLFDNDKTGNSRKNFDENGWQGWNRYTKASARLLAEQNWFEKYGLSVSSISSVIPLSPGEIDTYMARLPADLSETRKNVVRFALESVGKVPYYWGGKPSAPNYAKNSFGAITSPDDDGRVLNGLDCSGWINWVYWSATGKRLAYEGTAGLAVLGTRISRDQLKPGDIIVRTGADSHVIMFLEWTEDGQIRCIHESGGSVNNVSVSVRSANWPYYRRLVSD